jgi:hypothetical protein
MNTDIQKVITAVQNAQNPLIITKGVIPEDYALFIASLVNLYKDGNKKVTLVAEGDRQSWLQHISQIFNIEYTKELEALKHVIEIPSGDGTMTKVSYDISGDTFFLYITPGRAKFDFNAVKFKTFGSTHDVIFSIGIQSNEDLDKILGDARSAIIDAQQIIMGVPSRSGFQASDTNQSIHFVEPELTILLKMVLGLVKSSRVEENTRNSVAAMLLKATPAKVTDTILLSEVYRVLGELFKSGLNVENLKNLTMQRKIEYAQLYKKIGEKMKINTQRKAAFAEITQSDLTSTGLKASDLIISMPEVVGTTNVNLAVLSVDSNENSKIVTITGTANEVKQVATELKLTYLDTNAAGVVNKNDFAKVRDRYVQAPPQTSGQSPQPPQQQNQPQQSAQQSNQQQQNQQRSEVRQQDTPQQAQSSQQNRQPMQQAQQIPQPQNQQAPQAAPKQNTEPEMQPQPGNVGSQTQAQPTQQATNVQSQQNQQPQQPAVQAREPQQVRQQSTMQPGTTTINFSEIAKRIKSSS